MSRSASKSEKSSPIEDERRSRRLQTTADLRPLRDDSTARSIVFWVIGAVACVLVWASVTPVYETVTGEGLILPEGGANPVQSLDGGLVAEVLVKNGDFVSAGDLIVKLDLSEVRLSLQQLTERKKALDAEIIRQQAVVSGGNLRSPDTQAGRAQAAVFRADQAVNEATLNLLRAEERVALEQVETAKSRVRALEDELDLLRVSITRTERLRATGAVSERSLEDSQRVLLRTQQERAEALSQLSLAGLEAARATAALELHNADRLANATAQLATITVEHAELIKQIERLEERLKRDVLVAPIDGLIQGLKVNDPGQVIEAGDTIVEVIATDRELVAELLVSADEIGAVSKGLEASLKIVTFDFARHGVINAWVESISASSTIDSNGFATYAVRLSLGELPPAIDIRPGLTVTADLRTGRKTVLEYFLKPVRVVRDRALTEA